VRSSRRLERECRRNVEAMWLLRRLSPDFKTIADFRRDNGAAIVGSCRTFVILCRDAGLFTARLIALDGSKFRAVASGKKKVIGAAEIAEQAARLDRQIADYLGGLDQTDTVEPDDRFQTACTSLGLPFLTNTGQGVPKRKSSSLSAAPHSDGIATSNSSLTWASVRVTILNGWKTLGPVVSAADVKPHRVPVAPDHHPIAVVFDLMQPTIAGGRAATC
jgi:hypothetical protein